MGAMPAPSRSQRLGFSVVHEDSIRKRLLICEAGNHLIFVTARVYFAYGETPKESRRSRLGSSRRQEGRTCQGCQDDSRATFRECQEGGSGTMGQSQGSDRKGHCSSELVVVTEATAQDWRPALSVLVSIPQGASHARARRRRQKSQVRLPSGRRLPNGGFQCRLGRCNAPRGYSRGIRGREP